MKKFFFTFYFLKSLCSYSGYDHPIFETPEFQGFGGSGTVFATGESAIFYNPSLINEREKIDLVSGLAPFISVSDLIVDFLLYQDKYLESERKFEEWLDFFTEKSVFASVQNHTGVIFDKVAFGFLSRAHASLRFDGEKVDLEAFKLEGSLKVYNGVYYGMSRQFFSKSLSVGFVLKALHRWEEKISVTVIDVLEALIREGSMDILGNTKLQNRLKKSHQAFGGALDIGMTYHFFKTKESEMRLAYVVQNFLRAHYYSPEGWKHEENIINLAYGYETKMFQEGHRMQVAFDVKDVLGLYDKSFLKKIHFGMRWKYKKFASLAFGLSGGFPTASFKLAYKFFELQVSRSGLALGEKTGENSLGRTSLMLRFGWKF